MNNRSIFRRKSIQDLTAQPDESHGPKLNKVLNARDVFNHGVAAIIGTGIFVLTGVAAHDYAGPGILLSFLLAGFACAFVSFSYAELASMIPVSGSAYTYAYATLGEIVAWIIGWDLLLEYAVGASAVAVGWSAYLQNVLRSVGLQLPDAIAHAPSAVPWAEVLGYGALIAAGLWLLRRGYAAFKSGGSAHEGLLALPLLGFGAYGAVGIVRHLTSVDLPAVLIIVFLNFWLVKGVKHTAKMTSIFVMVKLAVILLFIGVGIWHIHPTNYVPFLPFGFHGVLAGAAIVFFAYIGFDAVTTLAEECKEPQKDVPKGVIGSLVVCTVLYLLVAAIMTGVISYTQLGGSESAAPMAHVLDSIGYWWASPIVSIGAIAGITSVLIVLLFGQSRIMMKMAQDGLIPAFFAKINPTYRTPVPSILVCGSVIAVMSGLLPISELAELTNIGTLAAFVLVCVGVIVLRRAEPLRPRKFSCPGYPYVPILGALMSLGLMFGLPGLTWLRFVIWMGLGLVIYFLYGRSHSRMNKQTLPPA